jgi:hypothetical protein
MTALGSKQQHILTVLGAGGYVRVRTFIKTSQRGRGVTAAAKRQSELVWPNGVTEKLRDETVCRMADRGLFDKELPDYGLTRPDVTVELRSAK